MYNPGSFTKNVGWQTGNQRGLQSLHSAIREGFDQVRGLVGRDTFRQNCDPVVDNNRQLVILNFFLHNTIHQDANFVTFDQLVRKAIAAPHSWNFDQLALFALHLAEMGDRKGQAGTAEGARFSRDYVKEVLWNSGGWQRSNLNLQAIERKFSTNLQVKVSDTVHKCATNYLFILQICGLTDGDDPIVNNQYSRWCRDAIYLFFDRVADNSKPLSQSELLRLLDIYEVYKLLGTTKLEVQQIGPPIADAYIREGGLHRSFTRSGFHGSQQPPVGSPHKKSSGGAGVAQKPGTASSSPIIAATDESDETEDLLYIQRRAREIAAQIRNPKNVRELKALYNNECAFCKTQTVGGLDPTTFYSEAAHVKPVGEPHNGPDRKDNMLLLCSEHHLQFDRGLHSIKIEGGRLYVQSKIPQSPIDGNELIMQAPHALREDCIKYHRKIWHFE